MGFWSIRKTDVLYNVRIKRSKYDKLVDYIRKNVDLKEINHLFYQSGLNMSATQYQIIRYVIFIVWITLLHLVYFLKGGRYPVLPLVIISIIFILFSPSKAMFGRKTLFNYLVGLLIRKHKSRQNIEIYRAITQLKNIAVAKKNDPLGSDFILQQLHKFTRTTRSVFNQLLALWSLGKKEEACDYFEKAIQTKEAQELANLFRKLDDLNPNELHHQIILLQEMIKRDRETKKIMENENKSNFVYLFVISTSMIILINFVVIVYYLETIKQLQFIN